MTTKTENWIEARTVDSVVDTIAELVNQSKTTTSDLHKIRNLVDEEVCRFPEAGELRTAAMVLTRAIASRNVEKRA